MNLKERISAFSKLGKQLQSLDSSSFQLVVKKAQQKNAWFTIESINRALEGIVHMLQEEALKKWASSYDLQSSTSKQVGVAMAGNIPLVGFHDYLCILIAGHNAQIKLSSDDAALLPYLHEQLIHLEPRFKDRVTFEERLRDYDAAIATGSDNTSRYFSYYFKDVPHIIRKNRSSSAVLIGEETEAELDELAKDVFTYFGLGCRNVSKLFIPEEYDLVPLLRLWEKHSDIVGHNKYANNYNYQKTIHLINLKHFYDNGCILMIENDKLVSPIAVLYYERYSNQEDLNNRISKSQDKLQCIVSAKSWFKGSVDFGKAQLPEVWDYADNVDTMKFLSALK